MPLLDEAYLDRLARSALLTLEDGTQVMHAVPLVNKPAGGCMTEVVCEMEAVLPIPAERSYCASCHYSYGRITYAC